MLLEITKHMLLENPGVLYNEDTLFNTTQPSNPLMHVLVTFIYYYLKGFKERAIFTPSLTMGEAFARRLNTVY